LITYVKTARHDRRYAMDARKIERELGWKPKQPLNPVFARRFAGILRMRLGAGRDQRKLPAVVATHYSGE